MVQTPQMLLNNTIVDITYPPTIPLLDVIRYKQNLMGTKIGCREGDCGACVVMIGQLTSGGMRYKTVTSCLTPIGSVVGKHVVTIEGVNLEDELNVIQQEFVNHGSTQCGACTPGFIVSMVNAVFDWLLDDNIDLIDYIDGNICRCTGYKSIEKAVKHILISLKKIAKSENPLKTMVENKFLPSYFLEIHNKMSKLSKTSSEQYNSQMRVIAGGTDLYVQILDQIKDERSFRIDEYNQTIGMTDDTITIGGSCTASQIMKSDILKQLFPNIETHFKLIASTPIRNMASIGGNIVNGSPIADMVIYFLPFNPVVELRSLSTGDLRKIDLKDIYIKYKTLDKSSDEIVESLKLKVPKNKFYFNFEKISKRTILDIASVNSAFYIEYDDQNHIKELQISAGGIYEIPKLLSATYQVINRKINEETILDLLNEIDQEISPISDVRGSALYKRRLLRNLVIAHFLEITSDLLSYEELVA